MTREPDTKSAVRQPVVAVRITAKMSALAKTQMGPAAPPLQMRRPGTLVPDPAARDAVFFLGSPE